jgi:hypothetical protein
MVAFLQDTSIWERFFVGLTALIPDACTFVFCVYTVVTISKTKEKKANQLRIILLSNILVIYHSVN